MHLLPYHYGRFRRALQVVFCGFHKTRSTTGKYMSYLFSYQLINAEANGTMVLRKFPEILTDCAKSWFLKKVELFTFIVKRITQPSFSSCPECFKK